MRKSTILKAAGISVCAALLGAAAPAMAYPVTITVNSDGDGLAAGTSDTVSLTNSITGDNIVDPLTLSEDDEAGGVTFFTSVGGRWNFPNTLFLLEPDGAQSDILTLLNKGGRAYIYFTSDDENGALGDIPILDQQFSFTESDTGIGVIGSFSILTPEPVTLSVFGAGLLGLAALRRRRKTA